MREKNKAILSFSIEITEVYLMTVINKPKKKKVVDILVFLLVYVFPLQ